MMWLLGEIWAWVLAGFALGLVMGWWIWSRRTPVAVTGQGDGELVAKLRGELDACTRARAQLDADLAAGRTRVAALTAELEALKAAPVPSQAPVVEKTGLDKVGLGLAALGGAAPAPAAPPVAAAPPAPGAPMPLFLDAPQGERDDVTLIKGIGPKLGALLNGIGIFHFRQIASWSAADVATVDTKLAAFKGRIQRDDWVAQAKLLAEGKMSEYRAKYGEPESRDPE